MNAEWAAHPATAGRIGRGLSASGIIVVVAPLSGAKTHPGVLIVERRARTSGTARPPRTRLVRLQNRTTLKAVPPRYLA
jgi:hypothetical protein